MARDFEVGVAGVLSLAEVAVEVAHLLVGNGEVALVVGALGLGGGEPLADREVL